MSDENRIQIQGGKIYYTEHAGNCYQIVSGSVLVYVVPFHKEKEERRMFLCETSAGNIIPALNFEETTDDGFFIWHFGLVALDKAEFTVIEGCPEEIKDSFIERASIPGYKIYGFEESIVECYHMNAVREMRNIFASEEKRKDTLVQTHDLIMSPFKRKKIKGAEIQAASGNRLYDACAYICSYMNIQIEPFEAVKQNCGNRFSVQDVARMSHFMCRKVTLDDGWIYKDAGALLCFRQDHKPVAVIPKKPGKYLIYDPEQKTLAALTRENAGKILSDPAYSFNRSFPDKELVLKDIFKFAWKDLWKSDLVWMLVFVGIGTALSLLIPFINQKLYDTFIPIGDKKGLIGLGCVLIATMVGKACFNVVKNLCKFRGISRMKYSIQNAAYGRLYNFPEGVVRKFQSSDLSMRAMSVSDVFEVIANELTTTGVTAVFSLLYFFQMFSYVQELSWIGLLMALAVTAVIALVNFLQMKNQKQKLEVKTETSALMYQVLSGIDKIRIAGAENQAAYEYLKPYTKGLTLNKKEEYSKDISGIISTAAPVLFLAVFYMVLIKTGLYQKISMGSFVAFTSAFGAFSAAILQLGSSSERLKVVKPTMEYIDIILKTKPESETSAAIPSKLTGDIEISNITFSYTPDQAPILDNLSLHVKAGEYIGIVGPSGCGKSTLLKLLLGFEQPQKGKIFYDNQDIDTLDKRELRRRLGVVLQNGGLISGSIYDNITITQPMVSQKKVEEVISEVGLSEDIAKMPMGLHTVLSEGSGTISGGQQQRILIARAMVGKPPILFFDEATSALDNITQAMVCESLEKMSATRIVIAHRLSTIMRCDRIVLLNNGRIEEEGSYDELMKKKGRFYNMAIRQLA
ncbi:MAG TPA: NHLP bacteriocin export ABC transporter permease/ATPase subunit [Lachnospiraceae bacterium]|nr:NHLP bacteriocin export ABC transporter permease/ATPase subunit [Lachnospiraceae bacterium]